MGRALLDKRRTHLATRLDATNDPEARRSLRAAFVETREIGDRVGALATASERIEARLSGPHPPIMASAGACSSLFFA